MQKVSPSPFLLTISKTKCIWKVGMYCTEVCSPGAGSPSVTMEERKGTESQQSWSGQTDHSWDHRAAQLTQLLWASLEDSLISRSSFLYYITFYLTKSRSLKSHSTNHRKSSSSQTFKASCTHSGEILIHIWSPAAVHLILPCTQSTGTFLLCIFLQLNTAIHLGSWSMGGDRGQPRVGLKLYPILHPVLFP